MSANAGRAGIVNASGRLATLRIGDEMPMAMLEEELVLAARSLLDRGERAAATACLKGALKQAPACLPAHNLLETHRLDGNFSDAFSINAQISEEDDIFRFFARHPSCTHPVRDYLADGWRTLSELMVLLETIDRPLLKCQSFLEFACGFGRFTRHLVRRLPPQRVFVSDVVPGSVDFLKAQFGATGFYSTTRPEDLVAPRQYQLIFVLSLFSHLPKSTWARWLAKLYDMLEPDGILVVTTHGEKCARMAGLDLSQGDGFIFFADSESTALDGEEYGATFTSTAFVRQVVAAHLPGARVTEFPAHFWGNQDGFAIQKSRSQPGAGDPELEALVGSANRKAADERFRASVWRHCAHRLTGVPIERMRSAIQPADQMLRHSLAHFREENRSLSQYYNVALQQYNSAWQLLRYFHPDPARPLEVLDFACGYGRLLRFLSLSVAPATLWAAEIQPDAVDFVRREYGVNALPSPAEPEQFQPARTFDFIWVASLFSHLPERLFIGWLRRLHGLLKPGGALCFSVHDPCLLGQRAEAFPAEGILFLPQSENADLDTATYGTTYVSEKFVKQTIAQIAGEGHPVFRIPRGLANEQDIYVLPKDRTAKLDGLRQFRRGPWGWVDVIRAGQGKLVMSGWAASFDDGAIERLEVRLDGQPVSSRIGLPRPDVARVLGDQRFSLSGWEFQAELPATVQEVYIEISAQTRLGEAALLYAGALKCD